MMKHNVVAAFFTILALLFAGTPSGHAQQAFAKLGSTFAEGHPALNTLVHFRDTLSEELTIQIFPDAQLGSAQQLMEGLQFGDIEMGILPLESVTRHVPHLAMMSVPYLFKDDMHRARVLDGPLGKQLLHTLDELNLVGLGFLETCPRFYASKDQTLHEPKNFQNRTIALLCTLPENECRNQVYELSLQGLNFMGAQPTLIPLEDLEASLNADNAEIPDTIEYLPFIGMERTLKDSGFNIITLPAYRTIPTVLVAAKRWFDMLSPQTQHAIIRASNMMVRQQRQIMEESLQHEYKVLQAQGIELVEGDNKDLREMTQPLYEEMAEQFGPEFEQLFQAVQTIRKEER